MSGRLGYKLSQLLQDDLNTRVTVYRSVTSGTDYNPADEVVATKVPILVVPVTSGSSSASLLIGLAENYDHRVTHLGLCEESADVQIGYWLTETAYRNDAGKWAPTTSGRRFLVMDRERFGAVNEPTNQVRLVLWRTER